MSTAYPSKWINGIDEFLVSHKFYFNTNLIWLKEKINEARGLINTQHKRVEDYRLGQWLMGYKSSAERSTHGTKDHIFYAKRYSTVLSVFQ